MGGAAYVEGKLYMCGGYDENRKSTHRKSFSFYLVKTWFFLGKCYALDVTKSDSDWVKVDNMNYPFYGRSEFSMVAYGSRIFVLGGYYKKYGNE